MSYPHGNDPDFDELTEEEFEEMQTALDINELKCKCSGDYCVC